MRVFIVAAMVLVLLAAGGCATPQQPATLTPAPSQPGTSAAPQAGTPTPSKSATAALTPADIPSMPPPGAWAPEVTNVWFPLTPGTTFMFAGRKDNAPTVEAFVVTHAKKVILGVPATVVHDTLRTKAGKLVEDTNDWYAQDLQGNVWYLGESTRTYKADGKSVESTEGSWQAGVDGAVAGVFMPAQPTVGFRQYQEYYKGQAEDQFVILSLDATVSVPYGSFSGAMLTSEITALEPGVVSHKYYVKNVGEVYELDVKGDNEQDKLVAVKR